MRLKFMCFQNNFLPVVPSPRHQIQRFVIVIILKILHVCKSTSCRIWPTKYLFKDKKVFSIRYHRQGIVFEKVNKLSEREHLSREQFLIFISHRGGLNAFPLIISANKCVKIVLTVNLADKSSYLMGQACPKALDENSTQIKSCFKLLDTQLKKKFLFLKFNLQNPDFCSLRRNEAFVKLHR